MLSLVVLYLTRHGDNDPHESSLSLNQELLPPFPVRELDKIYIYRDADGNTLVSDKPPEGFEYKVLEVPAHGRDPRSQQFRVEMANQARKIMRGQGDGDDTPDGPAEQDDGEQVGGEGLSGASAGDVLSRSNALRRKTVRP